MKSRKFILTISTLALVSFAASRASADTIFDLDQNNGSSSPTQTGAAVIGSSGDIWNALGANGVTGFALADTTGSTSAGLTYSAVGNSLYTDANGTAMDTATTPLMEDYMYGAGAGGPLTETISGLGNLIGYKLTIYIYAAGDASGQGSLITLGGTGISDTGATAVTTGANRKLSSGVGVAYQVFTGTITGSSFTITQDKNPGQTGSNGFLNGLQLDVAAVPEPSTYAMMLGGLGVLFALTGFRRLRTNA